MLLRRRSFSVKSLTCFVRVRAAPVQFPRWLIALIILSVIGLFCCGVGTLCYYRGHASGSKLGSFELKRVQTPVPQPRYLRNVVKQHKIAAGGAGNVWVGTYGGDAVALKQLFSSMIAEDLAEVFHVRSLFALHRVVLRRLGVGLNYVASVFCLTAAGVAHACRIGPPPGVAVLWTLRGWCRRVHCHRAVQGVR